MKGKKLPKKNSGSIFKDEDTLKRSPGVKLSQSKRSKKPSIYDEIDEFDDADLDDDFNDDEYDDSFDEDDDEDLY